MTVQHYFTIERRDGASRIGDIRFPDTFPALSVKRRVTNDVRRRLRDKVVLLYVGENAKALEIAEGLAVRGCDLVLICGPALVEEANWLQETIIALGRRCIVIVEEALTVSFYSKIMEQVYFTFGYLDLFVDYGGDGSESGSAPNPNPPSAVLLWLYFQLKRPNL